MNVINFYENIYALMGFKNSNCYLTAKGENNLLLLNLHEEDLDLHARTDSSISLFSVNISR